MKRIQKIMLTAIMALMAPAFTACTDYQDEIDALEFRISFLESLVDEWNTNLKSMTSIIKAVEEADYITNVTENSDGYIITFHKAPAIVILDGVDGKDGKDGKDAQTPDISVTKGEDGFWYWTLNGVIITNADGEKIRANGQDGKAGQDGKDGVDGKDAISPQVRINEESGIWEISVDGGVTWISTGTSATGNDGKDGKDGKDGQDGKDGKDGKDGENGKDGQDGKDGNQFFTSVTYEVNDSGEFMVVKTKAGQTFRIPIYKNS